ncbi:hypothetical protein BJV78DRAFT_146439 [Lactifluus subvellereus]|nr:hypothetical protein BJV78DRAFT_146439 [Lactifluus subvellereus]
MHKPTAVGSIDVATLRLCTVNLVGRSSLQASVQHITGQRSRGSQSHGPCRGYPAAQQQHATAWITMTQDDGGRTPRAFFDKSMKQPSFYCIGPGKFVRVYLWGTEAISMSGSSQPRARNYYYSTLSLRLPRLYVMCARCRPKSGELNWIENTERFPVDQRQQIRRLSVTGRSETQICVHIRFLMAYSAWCLQVRSFVVSLAVTSIHAQK